LEVAAVILTVQETRLIYLSGRIQAQTVT